jgi:hypothetical protein
VGTYGDGGYSFSSTGVSEHEGYVDQNLCNKVGAWIACYCTNVAVVTKRNEKNANDGCRSIDEVIFHARRWDI